MSERKRRLSRRTAIVGSAVGAAVVASTAAYAFISTGGSGTGNVSTAGPLQNLAVVGPTSFQLQLDQPFPLAGTFINDNSYVVSVSKVKVTVTGIAPGPGTCNIAPGVNFFTTDAVPASGFFTAEGARPLTGSGTGDWSGGVIEFRNNPTFAQNGCLNRRISVVYTAVPA